MDSEDKSRSAKISILIVEDDEPLRKLLAEHLRGIGFHVIEVGDCASAVQELNSRSHAVPDLVLTDIQLPDVDGGALASTVSNLGMDVPFIFMSGKTAGALSALNILPPDQPVLQKPFTLATLLESIVRQLGRDAVRRIES